MRFGDTANRWAIAYSGAAGTKSLGFYENGSSSHVMTLSGSRVGIGTTDPLGVFHASGSSGKSIVLGAAGLNGEGVYLAGYDGWATIIDQRHASDGHGLFVKLNHAETNKPCPSDACLWSIIVAQPSYPARYTPSPFKPAAPRTILFPPEPDA
jgi:hypothetical protein